MNDLPVPPDDQDPFPYHLDEDTLETWLYRELEERRVDTVSTVRFNQLKFELRGFFAKCLAVIAIIGLSSAFGLVGFAITLRDRGQAEENIQEERYEAALEACQSRNEQNAAIRAILFESSIPERAETFPIENCVDYANRTVNK